MKCILTLAKEDGSRAGMWENVAGGRLCLCSTTSWSPGHCLHPSASVCSLSVKIHNTEAYVRGGQWHETASTDKDSWAISICFNKESPKDRIKLRTPLIKNPRTQGLHAPVLSDPEWKRKWLTGQRCYISGWLMLSSDALVHFSVCIWGCIIENSVKRRPSKSCLIHIWYEFWDSSHDWLLTALVS